MHAGRILDDLMPVTTELRHPFTGIRGDRQQFRFAVPFTIGKQFEELGVDRHPLSLSFLNLEAEG
jgi:hypothetical protein